MNKETIAAIATPIGDGGVAIIRLSGPQALQIANHLSSKNVLELKANRLTHHILVDLDGQKVDEGMIVIMKAPKSFTGEDVVEFHCHGGYFLAKKILNLTISFGARLATGGEFTQRAYLNKKMDLAQAEAVQKLISAKNEQALKIANQQLEGSLSQKILDIQSKLVEQAAILEAWVDFPEEGLEFCTIDDIIQKLEVAKQKVDKLINSYHLGKALFEGYTLSLIGRPNVGKSSLMNLLLKDNRAIVTDIEGTTRDTLEEKLIIEQIEYKLIDTAGIRKSAEVVEKIGIERALKSAQRADLVLYVIDGSKELNQEDQYIIESIKNKEVLLVINKSDLKTVQSETPFKNSIEISCKNEEGIEDLIKLIPKTLMQKEVDPSLIYLSSKRHFDALVKAQEKLERVVLGLKSNLSCEWLSFDLKDALKDLSSIIGLDITENILSEIFSKFCVGK